MRISIRGAAERLYLAGEDVKRELKATWSKYATQGNTYAQSFLDCWSTMRQPSVMLSVIQRCHILRNAVPSSVVPSGIQINCKRPQQFQEKKITMGHKPDDQEEPAQTWGGITMGM